MNGELFGGGHHVFGHGFAHVTDADPCDFHFRVLTASFSLFLPLGQEEVNDPERRTFGFALSV